MMSELFDEEYLREQYNKSRERELLAEGEAKGTVSILIGLVQDGILTVADAAKRANMSVSDFEAKAKLI